MNDDFDKKDWRNDNEPEDNNDDFDIDWLKDTDDEGAPPTDASRTGVTGELSWLQGYKDAPDAPKANDDDIAFNWQSSQPTAKADDDDSELPPWLADAPTDDEAEDESPRFNFTTADDDEESSLRFANLGDDEDDTDAPTWLETLGDDEDNSIFQEALPTEDVTSPFVLSFNAPQEDTTPPESAELPSWLAGMDAEEDEWAGETEEEPDLPSSNAQELLPDWLLDNDDIEESEPLAADEPTPARTDIPDWVLEEDFDDDAEITAAQSDDSIVDDDIETPDLDTMFNLFDTSPEAITGDELDFSDDFEAQPIAPTDDFELDALLDDAIPTSDSDDLLDDLLEDVGADLDALLASSASQPSSEADLFADLDDEALAPDRIDFDVDDEVPTVFGRDDIDLSDIAEPTEDSVDWFSDDLEEAPTSSPDWLSEIEAPLPAEEDFLDDLRASVADDEETLVESADDLDSFFASIDDFDTSQLVKPSKTTDTGDLDALFDTATRQQIERRPTVEVAPDAPEWLREVTVSDDDESASSIIRRQADKPLDELDERLLALRERGLSLSSPTGVLQSSQIEGLGDIVGILPPADLDTRPEEIARTVVLNTQQIKQAQLLRNLVGKEVAALAMASHEEGEALQFLPERPRRRILPRLKLDRLIIASILLLAVLLPFFNILQIGTLPPAQFPTDSPSAAAFAGINALTSEQLVLVAVEYGPTAAGELDGITDTLLRHLLSRGARPVIISTNPVALLRAANLLDEIGGVPNQDYYVIRYLSGNVVGLRGFVENTGYLLRYDVRGAQTALGDVRLKDFSAIVVIAERIDDLRAYLEQIGPMTNTPIYAAIGASGGPLALPYLDEKQGLDGLLVGYRDAYTYAEMFNRLIGGMRLETPSETEGPSQTPPIEQTPNATTASPSPIAPSPTDVPPLAPDDPTPTVEILPTETPTLSPTATATATTTPSPSPTPITVAIVVATGNVNIRETPNGTPISFARPGEELIVLGFNEDGTWLNIRQADGTEGWIVASLLRLEERPFVPEGESKGAFGRRAFSHRQYRPIWHYQEDPTPTPEGFEDETPQVPTETDVPTETPTMIPTPSPTPPPESTPEALPTQRNLARLAVDREERWYAMTLGTFAAIVIIAFGAIINIVRALFRRGGE